VLKVRDLTKGAWSTKCQRNHISVGERAVAFWVFIFRPEIVKKDHTVVAASLLGLLASVLQNEQTKEEWRSHRERARVARRAVHYGSSPWLFSACFSCRFKQEDDRIRSTYCYLWLMTCERMLVRTTVHILSLRPRCNDLQALLSFSRRLTPSKLFADPLETAF